MLSNCSVSIMVSYETLGFNLSIFWILTSRCLSLNKFITLFKGLTRINKFIHTNVGIEKYIIFLLVVLHF